MPENIICIICQWGENRCNKYLTEYAKDVYSHFCNHFQLTSGGSWTFGDWINLLVVLFRGTVTQESFPDLVFWIKNAPKWTNIQLPWHTQPRVNHFSQQETTEVWEDYGWQEKGISINNKIRTNKHETYILKCGCLWDVICGCYKKKCSETDSKTMCIFHPPSAKRKSLGCGLEQKPRNYANRHCRGHSTKWALCRGPWDENSQGNHNFLGIIQCFSYTY